MEVKRDCVHFRGSVPCKPHKEHGVHCSDCGYFRRRKGRVLIIKLGAAGDVIRTTPILRPLRRDYPDHTITWLTYYPELLPGMVQDPRMMNVASYSWLKQVEFDLVLNFDKDDEACAIARSVSGYQKSGFTLGEDGFCLPLDDGAAHCKYMTGLFDDINKACELSYPQEIFRIAGYEFDGEEYVLDTPETIADIDLPGLRPLIGLNTGCGSRWKTRLWPENYWAELAVKLREKGYGVVILGGPDEDEKNKRLSSSTGVPYPGVHPLGDFIGIVDACDIIVTAVTMITHVAIGLRKKLVLFNNIFNPNEFELYGRGVILEPEQECECFFQAECTADTFCMETLHPSKVLSAIEQLLSTE